MFDDNRMLEKSSTAFFLAELSRLEILPGGYIYPKEDRPVRGLLRRRLMLVHQKTAHILGSAKSGSKNGGHVLKGLKTYPKSNFMFFLSFSCRLVQNIPAEFGR